MAWDDRATKIRRREFRAEHEAMQSVCWLCRQPIDYTAPPQSANAFEPDHVLPRSTHPELEDDPSNWRPSHASCNRSRKDGAPAPDLGSLSEQW